MCVVGEYSQSVAVPTLWETALSSSDDGSSCRACRAGRVERERAIMDNKHTKLHIKPLYIHNNSIILCEGNFVLYMLGPRLSSQKLYKFPLAA